MKIVSWNVRGQYTALHLAARMVANDWDVLIVLEPSSKISTKDVSTYISTLTQHKIAICICAVGGENIVVLYRTGQFASFEAVPLTSLPDYHLLQQQASNKTIFSQSVRKPIVITCKANDGTSYRIMSAHAPFWNNSGIASPYQQGLQELGEKLGVDVIVGDLNTYSTTSGRSGRSSGRNQYDFEMAQTASTSKGGYHLDKALLSKRLLTMMHHFFTQSNRVVVKDPKDIEEALKGHEEAEKLLRGDSTRASKRPTTILSRRGVSQTDNLDHKPIEVDLPKLLAKRISKPGTLTKRYSLKRRLPPLNMKPLEKRVQQKAKLIAYKRKMLDQDQLKKLVDDHRKLMRKGDALTMGARFIVADGNCLYRSLAYLIYSNQNRHAEVRLELAQYLLSNFADFHYLDFLSNPTSAMEYFDELLTDSTWGGEFEVLLASLCYGVTIHLHSEEGYEQSEYNPGQEYGLHLYHEDYHFFVLQ